MKPTKNKRIPIQKGIRYPRPIGLTALCYHYHKEPDPNLKQERKLNITKRIVEEYINTGMNLNGIPYTIEQIANYTDTDTEQILRMMNRDMSRISKFMDGEGGNLARALILGLFKRVQETEAKTRYQADILLKNQGTQYVPFLSSEVTKALQALSNSQKPLIDLLKVMMGQNPGTAGIINNGTINNTNNKNLITSNEAFNLLQSADFKSLIESPEKLIELLPALGMDGKALPEIRAQYQDLTKIGIKVPNKAKDGKAGKKPDRPDYEVLDEPE